MEEDMMYKAASITFSEICQYRIYSASFLSPARNSNLSEHVR